MSCGSKFLKPRAKGKTIDIELPKQTLEDIVTAYLYSISYLNDKDDVQTMDFFVKEKHIEIKATIKQGGV